VFIGSRRAGPARESGCHLDVRELGFADTVAQPTAPPLALLRGDVASSGTGRTGPVRHLERMERSVPEHETPLIATITAGLVLAFGFGLAANRLRLSPLIGYLLAGTLVGPFTPGFVADQALANQLAEVGVILLLFAVGLHFSLADLMAVRATALPGAIGQLTASTLLGMALARSFGGAADVGLLFGLALACGSTVVLTKSLQEHRLLATDRGRLAVGWLIVQDLVMVVVLVLVPALGHTGNSPASWEQIGVGLGVTLAKVAAFVAIMLIAGRRLVPQILHYTAHTGSRELFRLAVYAVALGVAFGALALFGVSVAVGAFFAGMVLAESPLSQRATEEALPLRDAFAVLFFVSVGMLFNPHVLVERPWAVLATLAVIVGGNGLAAFGAARLLGQSTATALTLAASLGQIGEFSFILAGLGVGQGILPPEGRDLILAGAILSILINPFLFTAVERGRVQLAPHLGGAPPSSDGAARPAPPAPLSVTLLRNHDVIVGYGRVGSLLGRSLAGVGRQLVVFDETETVTQAAQRDGAEVVMGNAADPEVLAAANLPAARRLFVTIPQAFEAGQVVQQARASNPALEIVARAHTDDEVEHLARLGADLIVMGEREIAHRMIERGLRERPA
jgi:monovalent cation:H+ antiporter-2, CPA2 family